jgi:hypothetical protein
VESDPENARDNDIRVLLRFVAIVWITSKWTAGLKSKLKANSKIFYNLITLDG